MVYVRPNRTCNDCDFIYGLIPIKEGGTGTKAEGIYCPLCGKETVLAKYIEGYWE